MIELLAILRRRWPLTVIAMLLVAAATVGAWTKSSPTYTYTSTILLLPPDTTTSKPADPGTVDFTKGNPLFYVAALNQTRDILIGQLTSKDTRESAAEKYPGVSYTAAGDVLGSSPVVVIATTGVSDATTRAAIHGISDSASAVLTSLQQRLGIKSDAMIRSQGLSTDQRPTVSNKSRIRRSVMVVGGVGGLAVTAIALLDVLLRGRRKRRNRSATAAEVAATRPADDAAQGDEAAQRPAARRDPADGPIPLVRRNSEHSLTRHAAMDRPEQSDPADRRHAATRR